MDIVHYDLNELKAAEEKLVAVVKEPHLQHAFTFAHSAFALVHQARGRTDAANQVAESVVSYCLDTNNPDLLKIAWAFQAELALRQDALLRPSIGRKNSLQNRFF